MYLNFFSFQEAPFGLTPDTRFFYESHTHEESVRLLLYGIEERKGFIVLTGEVGTGKTTTLRTFLNQLSKEVVTSLILNPLLSTGEILRAINRDFGLVPKMEESGAIHMQYELEKLNDYLLQMNAEGKNAVVIIDEAQNLSWESLETIRLLSNLETETQKLLQIILVGQPELKRRLGEEKLRQLRQRVQVHIELKPLNAEETCEYIQYRLKKAHPGCCLLFESNASREIYRRTGGIPRLINKLCDLSFMTAYAQDTHVISRKLVRLSFKEFEDSAMTTKMSRWAHLKKILGGNHVPRP